MHLSMVLSDRDMLQAFPNWENFIEETNNTFLLLMKTVSIFLVNNSLTSIYLL